MKKFINTHKIQKMVLADEFFHFSAKLELIFQSINLCLQRHQFTLNLLCSDVGFSHFMQNGQVLIGSNIQGCLKKKFYGEHLTNVMLPLIWVVWKVKLKQCSNSKCIDRKRFMARLEAKT